ncbi:MAG TPA: NUDIX domain-containing protein [Candidatus Woesebacteria bacterium]|nr:NUDIX domain-containing protein [Candidatus Woesebacteria bacterium]
MLHPILTHRLTTDVKLLHKVALVLHNSVLILKRAPTAQSRPNCWDLPGGNSEWPSDQTKIQEGLHRVDIQREILEETGISVPAAIFSPENLVYFTTFFEPDQQLYSINCGWLADLDKAHHMSGNPSEDISKERQINDLTNRPDLRLSETSLPVVTISNEHTQYAWIVLDQIADYDFGGPARDYETAIIRSALQNKKK